MSVKQELECMICGSRRSVYRAKGVCLCGRCLSALGEALEDKLHPAPKAR